jgi:hypothetical protein
VCSVSLVSAGVAAAANTTARLSALQDSCMMNKLLLLLLLLLLQGLGLLQPGSPLVKFRAALEVFDEACKLEPSFAEVSGCCIFVGVAVVLPAFQQQRGS